MPEPRQYALASQAGVEEQQHRSNAKQIDEVHGEKEACHFDEVLLLGKKEA